MDGVGASTMDKVRLILETGTCPQYETIHRGLALSKVKETFMKIHGVGPIQATKLANAGFKTIEELRRCPTIGEHLNEVQQKGIAYYDDILERIPYAEIHEHEQYLKATLRKVDPDADLTIAGSYRRRKSDSGDIDLLVKGQTRQTYERFIQTLTDQGYLVCPFAKGTKKYMGMGRLVEENPTPRRNSKKLSKKSKNSKKNRRIDIMYTKPDEYPFAILYFTGSSEFNQRFRKDILERRMTINEYSLRDSATKQKVQHRFHTERDIFEYLHCDYVEPWERV
jgi:DNA polymerase/3'-5' exonuclease PolX